MIGDIEAADRWSKELVNFEAADQRAAEYEAQQRATRRPWIVEGEEPNESLWTPEEFAAMQAAPGRRGRRVSRESFQTQPQPLSRASCTVRYKP